jgi:hypothetical protein
VKVKHFFRVIWPKIVRVNQTDTFILGGQQEETEQGSKEVFKYNG